MLDALNKGYGLEYATGRYKSLPVAAFMRIKGVNRIFFGWLKDIADVSRAAGGTGMFFDFLRYF